MSPMRALTMLPLALPMILLPVVKTYVKRVQWYVTNRCLAIFLGNTQGISGVARSRCQIQVDVFLPLYGCGRCRRYAFIADGSVQAQQSPVDWICSKCLNILQPRPLAAQSTNPDCFPGVYYGENPDNTA